MQIVTLSALLLPVVSMNSRVEILLFVVALMQKIRAFTWAVMDAAQCDPFVTQAQSLFAEVLQHRELQTELYCQLIRQTSKHPAPVKTPGVQVCSVLCEVARCLLVTHT